MSALLITTVQHSKTAQQQHSYSTARSERDDGSVIKNVIQHSSYSQGDLDYCSGRGVFLSFIQDFGVKTIFIL
jgi:hypothetical protein